MSEEPKELAYSDLIADIITSIKAADIDSQMFLRAEFKSAFRRTDEQINSALFQALSDNELPNKSPKKRHVDLQSVETLQYSMEGWMLRGDVGLTYGAFGTGKTTLALHKAYNFAKGKNILDRNKPCEPGKSLFIATDSGLSPLKKAMQDLGISDDDPLISNGPQQMIFFWGFAPEQGHSAWSCDIEGVIKLKQFIQEEELNYVVIDSAKSVSSRGGWNYRDNESVRCLLTYMREIICQPNGIFVEFLSHDGTEKGAHAGAKSWAEEPSIVIQLTPAKDIEGKQVGIKAQFKKDRAAHTDPRRTLSFNLDEGEMVLLEGSNVVGNCKEAITQILWEAYQRGNTTLSRKDITSEVYRLHRASSKTVDNTLGAMAGRRELVRPHRGHYALSPAIMQRLSYKTPDKLGGNISKTIDMTKKKQLPDHIPEGNSVLPKGKALGTHQIPLLTTDLR
ncbi:AAA family ATPase [Prochlorococcus sp. MIT 1307]|uniref:AAA family ATPase n=1 Tax=Prochlorococcus sp. MIT 1307 TaxID=3096219 RepID=UPI002A7567B6|nr:AAA family ATPase [Prochlorococcus sp. MIT 1307]